MSGLDIKLPTGGGASGSNPTVTPLGNVNAQAAARAGSAYSQAYSYLSTVFNNGSQQLNFEEGRLAANKMSAAQRNALNSLLVSMGYANAKNQQQLQSHYDEFLGEYRKGLAANSNLTLYGMVAGTINGGQWNTHAKRCKRHEALLCSPSRNRLRPQQQYLPSLPSRRD